MYGLGKVKDVIDTKHIGKVIRTFNEKFGYGNYLIVKGNEGHFADFMKFVKLPKCNINYWDSMLDDDVLEIMDFDFYTDYKSSVFVQHIEEHLNEMGLNEDQVMCKICGKLIGEIYDEYRRIKKTN